MFLKDCRVSSQVPRTIFGHAQLSWGNWNHVEQALACVFERQAQACSTEPEPAKRKLRNKPIFGMNLNKRANHLRGLKRVCPFITNPFGVCRISGAAVQQ